MLAAIQYEFQQYKLEDLMNFNMYTIYYLFGYVGQIANYHVGSMAYAMGNTKKYKYFIDK